MQKKKRSFLKQNKFLLVLFIGFFLYVGVTLINQELRARELKLEEAELRHQISALNTEITDLEQTVESSSSLEHIEALAREKLKMIKSDEIIYFLLPKEENKTD